MSIRYHLGELDIALNRAAAGHALPELPANCRAVLDVGCGIGQSLIALQRPGVRLCGVDVDAEAIRYGTGMAPHLELRHSPAEQLPYPDQTFDLVFSRVALPYTDIPRALAEMHRVSVHGGTVWLMMHPLKLTMRETWHALRTGNVRGVVGRGKVLLSGLLFNSLGRSWGETFQTRGGITRALRRAGFTGISHQRDHFIVTATRP